MEDIKKGIEKLKQFETYDEFVKDMEKSVKHSSPLSYLKWFFKNSESREGICS